MEPTLVQVLVRSNLLSDDMRTAIANAVQQCQKMPGLHPVEVAVIQALEPDPAKRQEAYGALLNGVKLNPEKVKTPSPSPNKGKRGKRSFSAEKEKFAKKMRGASGDRTGSGPSPNRRPVKERLGTMLPYFHSTRRGVRFYLIGDSQMVRLAKTLNFTPTLNAAGTRVAGELCVGGARLRNVKDSVTSCAKIPEQVMVMAGLNDILKEKYIEPVISYMKALMTVLASRCKEVIVLGLPPIRNGPAGTNGRIATFNDNLEITCRSYNRLTYVNLFDIFDSTDLPWSRYFEADGVHINEAGHHEITKRLMEVL